MSLAPKIRVNGIAPGPTIKNKRQTEKHFKKQYYATPLKQQVDVNEICGAVDFFIKNSSITGQVLAIDSGQSLSWQTATPANRAGTGFGGRLIDALPGMNSGLSLAGNISLSGNNSFQSGAATGSYAINANSGVKTIDGFNDDLFKRSFERLMTDPAASTLQTVYGSKIQSAIDAGEFFNSALGQATPLVTPFAGDSFSVAMKRIAELASLHEQLGVTRQTFFVTYGGWDHHEDTLGQQANMLPALDAGAGPARPEGRASGPTLRRASTRGSMSSLMKIVVVQF